MVSGFFTSPLDHSRIFSGEARLMRSESKVPIWAKACIPSLPRYQARRPIGRSALEAAGEAHCSIV